VGRLHGLALIDLCEHVFVGNAGSPQGRLRRALAVGDPLIAITAAADVERLVLDDALALSVLLLRGSDPRASRAAARAAGRFALEQPRVDLDELALVVSGLERMLGGASAPLGLRLALERRGLRGASEQLERDRSRTTAPGSGAGSTLEPWAAGMRRPD
jgi:hypothetical protein